MINTADAAGDTALPGRQQKVELGQLGSVVNPSRQALRLD